MYSLQVKERLTAEFKPGMVLAEPVVGQERQPVAQFRHHAMKARLRS